MRRRLLRAVAALVALGCAIELACSPKPLLIWNVTASAPLGLYRRTNGPIQRTNWVLIHAPDEARELAAVRHYLPRNVPMVKQIAATSGDMVCRHGNVVSVNGTVKAFALDRDRYGRDLPRWEGCQHLRGDQVFVLTRPPTSFDGRYFGAVPITNLIERIEPVWTF
jgi:conjugative transfer signal peptidase TraF